MRTTLKLIAILACLALVLAGCGAGEAAEAVDLNSYTLDEIVAKAASGNIDASYITSDSAYELAKAIYEFPAVIVDAGEKYEPSVVTRHIVDVAQAFNKFYHDEHVLVDNEEEILHDSEMEIEIRANMLYYFPYKR